MIIDNQNSYLGHRVAFGGDPRPEPSWLRMGLAMPSRLHALNVVGGRPNNIGSTSTGWNRREPKPVAGVPVITQERRRRVKAGPDYAPQPKAQYGRYRTLSHTQKSSTVHF